MLEISVQELITRHGEGAYVLDVREPHEYAEGHVPGAVLIPMAELPTRLSDIPDGQPIYVICRSGGRSLTSTRQLRDAGHEAYSVAGGTLGWIDAGQPTVAGMNPH